MSIIKANVILAVIVGALFSGGCMSIAPSSSPMSFILSHPKYSKFYSKLYVPQSMNQQDHVNVVFRSPSKTCVKFDSGKRVVILKEGAEVVALRDGVYPFTLQKEATRELILRGAMMVRNMDKEVALATLGKTEETKMFNDELLRTALKGQLASYTVSFDGKDIITYWLGNRRSAYTGGEPTVELDFSGMKDIEMLKIGKRKCRDKRLVVNVYGDKRYYDRESRRSLRVPAEYPIEFTADGNKYRGYVRNLKDNEFTAFVRIPCTIPSSLLRAAASGTVSKFTVQSTGERAESVAEIVISSI